MVVKVAPLGEERLKGIRRDLAAYEARYGVPSDRLAEAFTHRGHLEETDDYRHWQFLWSVCRRLDRADVVLVR